MLGGFQEIVFTTAWTENISFLTQKKTFILCSHVGDGVIWGCLVLMISLLAFASFYAALNVNFLFQQEVHLNGCQDKSQVKLNLCEHHCYTVCD